MKVLANGGLNISELDGWWAEAYAPDVGWALGDGQEHGDDPAWDAVEADALFDLLEREVVPQFYSRDARGIPTAWVTRMRESMARLTPRFSTNRVVREYTDQHYLAAARRYRERSAQGARAAHGCLSGRTHSRRNGERSAGKVNVEKIGDQHQFDVDVHLAGLDPDAVRVELYADGPSTGLTCKRRWRGFSSPWVRTAAPIARAYPLTVRRRTTRCGSYRTMTARPSPWRRNASCGSDDPDSQEDLAEEPLARRE